MAIWATPSPARLVPSGASLTGHPPACGKHEAVESTVTAAQLVEWYGLTPTSCVVCALEEIESRCEEVRK